MTTKTSFQLLAGSEGGKSADGIRAAADLDMKTGGSVATFAAGLRGLFFARRDGFVVRILVEVQPHVGVTGFANLAAHVPGRGLRRRLPLQQQRQKQ